ncbi:hypothetical protein J4418_02990 [Candidatus Woesearchaeota archaeon]|nr:hypothetical protein [Candidatus Woesearchaeota archaeon]
MVDIRKILIIFVIGILYGVFVHSFVDAVYPEPRYEDYCNEYGRTIPFKEKPAECEPVELPKCKGYIDYQYNSEGCPILAECNLCSLELEDSMQKHNLVYFILSSIFGLFAISLAIYLPLKKNELNEWIGTGFMLGGILSIFIGTAIYYGDMARIFRPFVILVELIIIISLAYKKIKA